MSRKKHSTSSSIDENLNESPHDYCSYSSNNSRLRIQRLLRQKIIQAHEKCLLLNRFRQSSEAGEQQSSRQMTKKRRKTIASQKQPDNLGIPNKRSLEPDSIRSLKAMISEQVHQDLFSLKSVMESHSKKNTNPRQSYRKVKSKKREHENGQINISLNLKPIGIDNETILGHSQDLHKLYSKLSYSVKKYESRDLFLSISEKKELSKKTFRHVQLEPIHLKKAEPLKKARLADDCFSPWERVEVDESSFDDEHVQ